MAGSNEVNLSESKVLSGLNLIRSIFGLHLFCLVRVGEYYCLKYGLMGIRFPEYCFSSRKVNFYRYFCFLSARSRLDLGHFKTRNGFVSEHCCL